MSHARLRLSTALDVVGDCYSRLLDEWVRPTTKAGMLARLEAITKELEGLLLQGNRDPRAYMLPKTAKIVMERRPRADYAIQPKKPWRPKRGPTGSQT